MSRFRHLLWRAVCWLAGGLTVTGRLPSGACVIVANHSSHADTAALLAALPPSSRPVFAAAADYWFAVPARRAAATGLAGILPVQRGREGAYAALLAAAGPALAAGRAVVVYPEGTRTTDGTIGTFRSGAVRLARDCGVPVVPVAVLGTRDVLPKHGRLRPAPMEVRIGTPRRPAPTPTAVPGRDSVPAVTPRRAPAEAAGSVTVSGHATAPAAVPAQAGAGVLDPAPATARPAPAPASGPGPDHDMAAATATASTGVARGRAAALRDDVVGLIARGPARARTSAVWTRVARLAGSRRGLVVAFCWGLAEALSWPVMAEMTLVFLAAAVPSRVPALASSIVAGSLAGVLVNARLTAGGGWLPAPLTTPRMQDAALADLADGAPGILHQALSGIPVKLYARAAGELGIDPASLLLWAGIERGLRMAAVAVVVSLVARRLHGWLRRCYGTYLLLASGTFTVVLALIIAAWS